MISFLEGTLCLMGGCKKTMVTSQRKTLNNSRSSFPAPLQPPGGQRKYSQPLSSHQEVREYIPSLSPATRRSEKIFPASLQPPGDNNDVANGPPNPEETTTMRPNPEETTTMRPMVPPILRRQQRCDQWDCPTFSLFSGGCPGSMRQTWPSQCRGISPRSWRETGDTSLLGWD